MNRPLPTFDINYLPRLPKDKSPPIGCIASGFIMADCHLVAYRKAGFNPVAIASRTPAHARRVAERHGLTAYDTYQEMLASGKVEVVDIAVPREQQRRGAASNWTIERADSSIRYRRVQFTDPDEILMLPSSIDTVTIVRNSGSPRTRISQTFSNYRRFVTGSRIVQ